MSAGAKLGGCRWPNRVSAIQPPKHQGIVKCWIHMTRCHAAALQHAWEYGTGLHAINLCNRNQPPIVGIFQGHRSRYPVADSVPTTLPLSLDLNLEDAGRISPESSPLQFTCACLLPAEERWQARG